MRVLPSILNGAPVLSTSVHPVYSHAAKRLHDYSPIDKTWVPKICSDSMAGFAAWKSRPFGDRTRILSDAAALIEAHSAVYLEAHRELGCAEPFASVGVAGAVANIREYASKVSAPDGALLKSADTSLAFTVSSPIGPVLSMASWNAPVILAARAIAAPLAAGCSVVFKANEKSPRVPHLLVSHFLEAGVDPAALQLVHVEPYEHQETTRMFLEDPNIRMVNFTGSTEVGRHVAQVAARNLKPALLELGGKNVSVVLGDADVAAAAASALFSAWFHMGQICMCLDTVYVHETVYDEFKVHLATASAAMLKDEAFHYAQRDHAGAEKVRSLVSDALSKGATGSVRLEHSGNISPLVLEGITPDMNIHRQETFGPVLCLEKYSDLDAVVQKANSSAYGLKASVWSKDVLQAVGVAKRLEAGGVHVNHSTIHDEPTVPHGGIKESGSGRFNSTWGLQQFQYTKSITVS